MLLNHINIYSWLPLWQLFFLSKSEEVLNPVGKLHKLFPITLHTTHVKSNNRLFRLWMVRCHGITNLQSVTSNKIFHDEGSNDSGNDDDDADADADADADDDDDADAAAAAADDDDDDDDDGGKRRIMRVVLDQRRWLWQC